MFSAEAMAVLQARYLTGRETPEDLFRRVANFVAQAEARYGGDEQGAAQEFYRLMSGLSFLPNSPALMNAGKQNAQLAACFVLPIEDSLSGIFDTLKHTALIHQSGGGTGFSFSRLRPRGDGVASTGGTTSGPVSFMHIYNLATQVVKQGAVRSGANMAVLRVDHPDILEFIEAKRQENTLTNFNISVGITDAFMQAVKDKKPFPLLNPRTGQTVRLTDAAGLFDRIVEMAWRNGEPGLFFLDTVNRANPTPHLGEFESPNPCSEQPLLPYESCVLGSINLTRMLKREGPVCRLDESLLKSTVRTAVRFLDDVIEVNSYPLEMVAAATLRTRKIGLGIMGLADLFIMLDIPYASQAAVDLTRYIMCFITREARAMSRELAVERGPFPAFAGSIFDGPAAGLVRNATVTTIAPTGSISIIGHCSSGIEPLFALATSKRVLEGRVLVNTNPVVLQYLRDRGLLTAATEQAISEEGHIQHTSLPAAVKQVLATAHEIAPSWHVAHLAAAQQYTDNGVSKTVNLPRQASRDDVANVFFAAYESGCKGVTVYRDGSRSEQVLNPGTASCTMCGEEA